MSSKKTSPSPDDLFRSIPPAEQFHAFPALDAFPAEAIAFLTGRRETPAMPAPTPPQTRPVSRPHSRPQGRPHSQPLDQSPDHTASQTTSHKVRRSASHTASQTQDHTTYPAQDRTPDHTQDLTQGHSADLSSDSPPARPSLAVPSQAPPAKPAAPSRVPVSSQAGPVAATSDTPAKPPKPAAATKGDAHPVAAAAGFGLLSDPGPAARLNANQRRVLLFLLQARPYIITFARIAASTGLGEASARTILRRLAALDFLTFKKARDGNLQGVRMAFNQELCQAFRQSLDERQEGHTQNRSIGQSQDHSVDLTQGQPHSQPVFQPATQPATLIPLLKKEGKESILPGENQEQEGDPLAEWTDDLLALLWPKTFAAGFRMEHLRRVADMRRTLGRPLERDMVRTSLDRGEWELEKFGHLNDLSTNEKVRNVQAYLFTALARWGILRPHPDYVSREEELLNQAAKEHEQRRQAARQLEDSRFQAWRDGLSPAQLDEAMRGCPGGPKDIWLKTYWKKNLPTG